MMKRRILSFLLVSALAALSLLPAAALAADSSMNFVNQTSSSGEGYAWDGDAKTLRLDGLELTDGSITLPADAVIELAANSDNIITSKIESNFAIYAQGSLTILGDGSLTIESAGPGIGGYESSLSIQGNPTLTVNAAEDALVSGDWQGMTKISGAPTIKLFAGAEGIKAVGGMEVSGGTLCIQSSGNGIYVDGSFLKLTACDLTICSKGNGIAGYFRDYGGGEDGCVIENSTLDIAAASCIYSEDRTITVTDSTLCLQPNTGAGLLSENEQIIVTNGTTTISNGSVGLDSANGAIFAGTAQVTLDTDETIRGVLTLQDSTSLTLGAASNTTITDQTSWVVESCASLCNNGGLENHGGLLVTGSFINLGTYVHAVPGALTGTGTFSKGTQAKVIMLAADEEAVYKLEQLGTLFYARTEPLDYTASTLPSDGDGYSWDAENRTLTLSGAVIITEDSGPALRLPEDAKIFLATGSVSQIQQSGETEKAIRTEGNLLIYGEGTLRLQSDGIAIDVGAALTVCGAEIHSWSAMGIVAESIHAAGASLGMLSTTGACLTGTKSIVLDHVAAELISSGDTVIRVSNIEDAADAANRLQLEPMPEGIQVSVWPDEATESSYAALAASETDEAPITSIILSDRETHHVVIFEAGNGSGAAYQIVPDGARATKPDRPKRDGYHFCGWYQNAACTKAWNFKGTVTDNVTLYAKWIQNNFSGIKTETSTNPDGSTTKKEIWPNGTVIETITNADGSTIRVEIKKDGSTATVTTSEDKTNVSVSIPTGLTGNGTVSAQIKDSTGENTVTVTVKDGRAELSITGSAQITILDDFVPRSSALPFTKVTPDAWCSNYDNWIYYHGLLNDTSETTFSPKDEMTRAILERFSIERNCSLPVKTKYQVYDLKSIDK